MALGAYSPLRALWPAGVGFLTLYLAGIQACTTPEVSETPEVMVSPTPPPYVSVPHPAGLDLGDLSNMFLHEEAPSLASLKTCDQDFSKLKAMTSSKNELADGARELVAGDPVSYHWCFYGKIMDLENKLKTALYVDEKQKYVIESYSFLVSIGRSFMLEFKDSRYIRWAVWHYRKLSEVVFYRALELSPDATSELVETENPFGLWRKPASRQSILEKYKIKKPEKIAAPMAEGDLTVPSASHKPPETGNEAR